ncbi:hypothetical protein PHYC_02078 [Phycisphaerales bacterium]|nr:hypothetical protein PHYC_02078 [Phycisphaerales bacterium]
MRILSAIALVAASPVLAATIVNGSFELPGTGFQTVPAGQTFGSWTCTGPSDIEFVNAAANGTLLPTRYDGDYWIDLTGVGAPSGIRQTVATTSGQGYRVDFAMSGNPFSGGQVMVLNVLWNGALAGTFSHDTTGHPASNMGWTVYTVDVIGTGSDVLTFQGVTGVAAAGVALDDVGIEEIPAPGAGLALLVGAAMWGRRRR